MAVRTLADLVRREIAQRREEGCDVEGVERNLERLIEESHPDMDARLEAVWDEMDGLLPDRDFPYHEPSKLEEIREARPEGSRVIGCELSDEELYDRIHGAWLGRCAGCLLGKPVEGWPRERIESYLRLADAYPLDDYFPRVTPHPEGYRLHPSHWESMQGSIGYMPRDDDVDYTILGLHVLEGHGAGFTTGDVAAEWLTHPLHDGLHGGEGGLQEPSERAGAARDCHLQEPLQGVDRGPDQGGRLGLCGPGDAGACSGVCP